MTPRIGRPMESRIRVRAWLRTESPLHVGGMGLDRADSLPLAQDGRGRFYVPGTSLAGALRSWMRGSSADGRALDGLWGYATPRGEEGHASRVVVHDALVALSDRVDILGMPADPLPADRLEVRTSVGIDRVTGTAAPEILYSRSVIPVGHYLRFELDVECADREAQDRARVKALLDALLAAEVRLGAATGRGLGRVRLLDDPLDILLERFDSPQGLLAALRQDPSRAVPLSSLSAPAGEPDLPPRRAHVQVRIAWRPLAPVMAGSGADGLIVHTLPSVARVDSDNVALVLPGSTIKGVLRARAEFIERTARGISAPRAKPGGPAHAHSTAFRAQLDQLPAVTALFGTTRKPRARTGTGKAAGRGAGAGAGALRAEECLSAALPAELWRATTGLTGQTASGGRDRAPTLPETVLDRLAELGMAPADHVAIDRWTGGAADNLLFSVLEPHAVAWAPLRLTVDLPRLGTQQGPALALLLLVLRDLAAGRVPLGAATGRGFGDISVSEITLDGGPWPPGTTLGDALGTPHLAAAWQAHVHDGAPT